MIPPLSCLPALQVPSRRATLLRGPVRAWVPWRPSSCPILASPLMQIWWAFGCSKPKDENVIFSLSTKCPPSPSLTAFACCPETPRPPLAPGPRIAGPAACALSPRAPSHSSWAVSPSSDRAGGADTCLSIPGAWHRPGSVCTYMCTVCTPCMYVCTEREKT